LFISLTLSAMAAKGATTSSKKKTAAAGLKSPKTPKADKIKAASRTHAKKEDDRLKTGLNEGLVQKATEALLKYHEKISSTKKDLLGSDQQIQVQFSLLRTPQASSKKPIRVMIPHPLFQMKNSENDSLEEPEVCLIVKEESKPWCKEMIERFPEEMGCIKKVLGLQSLRTKHARYEQRRALLHKYNIFMADDRILPMLSKALGSDFYKAKKLPIPITLTRKEALPFTVQRALNATYFSISKGTCITIRYVLVCGTNALSCVLHCNRTFVFDSFSNDILIWFI
jgi:ribosome biogenesis protein UTP30